MKYVFAVYVNGHKRKVVAVEAGSDSTARARAKRGVKTRFPVTLKRVKTILDIQPSSQGVLAHEPLSK